ncbi:TIGR00282 family metallophosphoesterase [Erysipelothrix urinaevulpis]|uniref:TIGR00282 family metallophosphoesterase n=1 Tax=Erysipelothrix urinaevulpis TaxID=2683717 RepID=UPI00135B51F0|nr:TIGR00282 family metallophosphoesterase [Erysipelothrix urinaevulpis]
MKILFIGDIVGKSGRQVIADHLPLLKAEQAIDFIIANGENAAHGKGITKRIYRFFMEQGIDCVTMGNHTFAKREIMDDYEECPNLLVPANIEPLDFGNYYKVYTVKEKKICVVNLYGEAFMNNVGDRPYKYMDKVLDEVDADYYFVDFHGESTSEKIFFAKMYQTQVDAVVGTHTHVQTADEKMMGTCAYITDVGMCGPKDGVIGRDFEELYDNMVVGNKTYYKLASGEAMFNAVMIEIDESSMTSLSIQRLAW